MPGYWLFVTLHVMAGALALGCFWAAAWLRKGSPRHRAVGKVFLLAMTLIVLTSVPITVQFAWYRQQPLSALFLVYLMALTGNALWLSWRAVTDKRDWRVLVARPGWALSLWPMLLSAIAVLAVGLGIGQPLFVAFSSIGLWAGWRMWRFARRGPQRADWALRQHYQSMLGAGIATHVAFFSIGMRPVWRWLQAHLSVPAVVIELFPWLVPVAVAVLASCWLERRYGRSRSAAATSR
ncbi:hypothetical protein ABB30_01340 [Stenotrophomonas ginsengisoli]|uniref:DUF2306 domain-containing protein n=1 Tax=Stenotrophomonas ginsengisoli TaxID=336566 RepID=A0A0R0DNR9_9GAMM|nr:hypothetical protein [Stenotrophomonas ginsengisoli]KRG79304.1 hypothetical protein ABB30_01340 [Stenotrophomonas ginsengisoli]